MADGDYCSLAELKGRLWPSGAAGDTLEDDQLTNVIAAVSRTIDSWCGRRFYSTSDDETRYYQAAVPGYLFPSDDILSITGLWTDQDGDRVYEDTWTSDDYDAEPGSGPPYLWLQVAPLGNYHFSRAPRGVKITGKFGYCATGGQPAAVKEACLLQAVRTFRRTDAPFGVVQNPAGGNTRLTNQLDPDVELMLAGYRRLD